MVNLNQGGFGEIPMSNRFTQRRGTARRVILTLSLGSAMLLQVASTLAQEIGRRDLLKSAWSGGLAPNTAFVPSPRAAAAHEPFLGTVHLVETPMNTQPSVISVRLVLGRDPGLFPGVALSFFTDDGDLVPFTQDVIRSGSTPHGRSYWDILVQPGQVWSEPGDGGWSRAAFPFALVNSIEGETHDGLAIFLYKRGRVSNLRFQIVQQTAPFNIKNAFTAAGLVPARVTSSETDQLSLLKEAHAVDRIDGAKIAGWSELEAKVGGGPLAGFDGSMPPADIVLSGLDYQGTFYLKQCASAGGPLPWCERARFGVWSATKVLANETALLRLAEKYGPAVFDLKIADYVPEAKTFRGWQDVRFEDAINMATGNGNGSTNREPNDTNDGYIDARYSRWYEAGSLKEKLAVLLADGGVYPWGPGQVTRYRDQDMFMLGVAMDRFLKSKEGPTADIWSMLRREVFGPIGVHHAPTNRTIEVDGSAGQPLMAYGYYPTLSDMVLIARLYQNGGRHGERQLLFAPRVKELLAGPKARGLPTGEKLSVGETTYINAFWVTSFQDSRGCRMFYPRMLGWGGNLVALMPGGMTGIRLAKSGETADGSENDTSGMARVADNLSRFRP